MTDQQRQQLAQYIAGHPVLGRQAQMPYSPAPLMWQRAQDQQLPSREDLAEELLEDSEFLALRLGTLAGSPDGRAIAEVVRLAIAPEYRDLFSLAVDGLTLAAERQSEDGRRIAGVGALAIVGVSFLLAVMIAVGKSAS